jgi:peptide/nickel transport system ATP-binding protein
MTSPSNSEAEDRGSIGFQPTSGRAIMIDDEHSLADEDITTVMAGSSSIGRVEAAVADRDGTDGADSDGTDGADSDGTDGADSDGTDGADSDGTDGADSDGTDASGA